MGQEIVIENTVPDNIAKAGAEAEVQIARIRKRRTAAIVSEQPGQEPPVHAQPEGEQPPARSEVAEQPSHPAQELASSPQGEETTTEKRENQDLRHQLSVVHGRYGDLKAKTDQMRSDLETLKSSLADRVDRQTAPTPASEPAKPVSGAPEGLSEEEIKARYGEEFLQIADWRANKAIQEAKLLIGNGGSQNQSEMMQRMKALESQIAGNRFWDDAERLSSGVSTTNGDPDKGIPAAPGWAEFLDEPIRPGSTFTKRMEAEQAVATGNPAKMADLHDEFRQRVPSAESPKPTTTKYPRVSIAAQIAPTSVGGSAPPANGKKMVKASDINHFSQLAGQGQIKYEDADKLMREYLSAIRERRVVMDESLRLRGA